MLEKMRIEKDKAVELLKDKDEILRKEEEFKKELKKLQKMKEFKGKLVGSLDLDLG